MNNALTIWDHLTEPTGSLIEQDDRFRARLLASLYLAFIPIALILAIATPLVYQGQFLWEAPIFRMMLIIVFVFILMYLVSRTRYYRFTVPVTVTLASFAILIATMLQVGPHNSGTTAYYLILPVLVAAIFMSLPSAILVAFLNGAILFLFAWHLNSPEATNRILIGPFTFFTVMVVYIFLATQYRNQIEKVKHRQLVESRESYRELIKQASDGILISDNMGCLVDANERICKMLGYSRTETLAQNFQDLLTDENNQIEPIHFEDLYAGKVLLGECLLIRKDGEHLPVEISAKMLPDGRFQAFIRDITWRIQAEAALRQSEATHRALLRAVPDPIFRVKPDGHILDYIPGKVAEVWDIVTVGTETSLFQFVPPNLVDEVKVKLQQALENDEMKHLDYSQEIQGSSRYFDIRIVAAQADELLCILRDVTEQKQAEALMYRKQKMESLGVLASGVAHDFNNLLVAILGQSSLALKLVSTTSPGASHIKKVIVAAEHASNLTKQMLAYSGHGHFKMEPLQLNEIIQENLHLFRVAVPGEISLTANLEPTLSFIDADAGQIQQVVMNLIINGAEAIESMTGEVLIETENIEVTPYDEPIKLYAGDHLPPGTYVHLTISDTGKGMTEETLEKIFDPFFTTKFTGRGLGLAAVLGIIKGHHGGLSVHSRPDQGTAFHVYFPASRRQAVESSEPTIETIKLPSAVILVIDDEELVLEAIAEILGSQDIEVLQASDGRVGIDIFTERANDIDLVLLDISMPKMTGEEVFMALKSIKPEATIILSSGYDALDVTNRLSGITPSGFLKKPYQINTLLAYLQKFLPQ